MFLLFLYLHVKGCLWFFLCEQAGAKWIPPLNFLYIDEPEELFGFFEKGIPYKYSVTFYNAVIMLKGNELAPRTNNEIVIGTLFLIFDLIIAATIFGNVAVLVSMSNRKSALFQSQIDTANTAMNNMQVPY